MIRWILELALLIVILALLILAPFMVVCASEGTQHVSCEYTDEGSTCTHIQNITCEKYSVYSEVKTYFDKEEEVNDIQG